MASLAELEARVAALESAGESEVLQSNYLTVDPITGVVAPRFPSLWLPAATTGFNTPNNRVLWQDTSTGAMVADIVGTVDGVGNGGISMEAFVGKPSDPFNPTTTIGQFMLFMSAQNKATAQVRTPGTTAPTQIRTLLDETGASDYVQTAPPGATGSPVTRFGNPMLIYHTAQSGAVGANANFNYIGGVGLSPTIGTDPNGCWGGSTAPVPNAYQVRATGVYLAFGSLNWPTSAAVNGMVGAQNPRTSYMVATEFLSATATATSGASFISLIPCNQGDGIVPVARVSASVSIGGVLAGTPGTWFGCMQVM